MKSFSTYQSSFASLSKNSSTANQALGILLINDSLRYLTSKFYLNERQYKLTTVASQQFYPLPPQVKELISVTVTIGGVVWTLNPVTNWEYWNKLNVIQFRQDYPQFFFPNGNGQVGIFPTPASSGNLITQTYKTRIVDLSQADYTTGTVTLPYVTTFTGSVSSGATSATLSSSWTLPSGSYNILFSDAEQYVGTFTNGSTAVTWTTALTNTVTSSITISSQSGGTIITGSGTTFIQNMQNRWIQIPEPTGDGNWYQIQSYLSATAIVLYNAYTGPAVSGGTFTIGEMPILPEDYQDLALYRALWIYYNSIVPNQVQSKLYENLYDLGYEKLNQEYGNKTTSPVLQDETIPIYNPNLFLSGQSQI